MLKKMADVASQSTEDLVDGLGYYREEYFDYSTYSGREFDKGNWFGSEGYICPSTVLYVKPSRARNVQGDWRVIVQGAVIDTKSESNFLPSPRSRCHALHFYDESSSFTGPTWFRFKLYFPATNQFVNSATE